jgi:hypothetical protein
VTCSPASRSARDAERRPVPFVPAFGAEAEGMSVGLQILPLLFMIIWWVVPIVVIWWMVRTLSEIKNEVRRIADVVANDKANH